MDHEQGGIAWPRIPQGVVIDGDPNKSGIGDSYSNFLRGFYPIFTLGRRHFRIIGAPKTTTSEYVEGTVNETIDASVFDRWRYDAGYRPKNLMDWAERKKIPNIADLRSAVMADNPSVAVP